MINFVSELRKLKRSSMLFLIPLASIVPVILSFVPAYLNYRATGDMFDTNQLFQGNIIFLNLLIGIPLFALITGEIVVREYQLKTINYLFTSPGRRIQFLINKLMVIFVYIVLTFVFSMCLTLIVVGLAAQADIGSSLSSDLILSYLQLYGLSIWMQFLLVPITMMVSIATKNIIAPIILAIFGVIIAGTGLGSQWATFFPWAVPSRIVFALTDYGNYGGVNVAFSMTILVVVFLLALLLSMVLYEKADVDDG
ncbi:ABC transporter permease [Virgibacillus sp. NKC19-3]|uniref:ABC transporter permease n=1 Tax=Virgibacillus saliphilus TaxID=2831674 RepID=UPI001C9B2273|nr:ABC transporter permease [Virgibacillus sp. NKC19-3]MBY7142548.1 ABC transporter permease [Virgibacillus sp. NKC19-3]